MAVIRTLDRELVNKIAAGEVIERPFSVVKELIENSIDSGATRIEVEVKDGGRSLVRVADDGCGMDGEDALACFTRHGTSKIPDNDIFSIHTLGFRGEALSSIAAVSHVRLTTGQGGLGTSVEIEGGRLLKQKDCAHKRGTTVEVTDLFFNTPVRKKYLKARDTELRHISDIVTRYALTPLAISLKSDSALLISTPRDSLLNKIVTIYGKDTAKNMVPVEYSDSFVKIDGYIGKPYIARQDRNQQTLIINGRYVKNEVVGRALYDAYHSLLFLDRHPVAILFFTIDFSKVDVNVHPTKSVIRIEKEDELYRGVYNAVRDSFHKNALIPEVDAGSSDLKARKVYRVEKDKQTVLADGNAGQPKSLIVQSGTRIGPVRVLGQVNRVYIIAEDALGLLIVDQHAAQERILYEKYMAQAAKGTVPRQRLLRKLVVELAPDEFSRIMDAAGIFGKAGFDIDAYGKNAIVIREIPRIIPVASLRDIIGAMKSVEAAEEEKVIRMACRKAVKAGEILTLPQMEELILALNQAEKPFTCPHGRPTIIRLSLGELEKKFLRSGG
ncbi:MAG: DNA mismatch repair endonuclease MutL [archaeon]